jgi:hypothetical protein
MHHTRTTEIISYMSKECNDFGLQAKPSSYVGCTGVIHLSIQDKVIAIYVSSLYMEENTGKRNIG